MSLSPPGDLSTHTCTCPNLQSMTMFPTLSWKSLFLRYKFRSFCSYFQIIGTVGHGLVSTGALSKSQAARLSPNAGSLSFTSLRRVKGATPSAGTALDFVLSSHLSGLFWPESQGAGGRRERSPYRGRLDRGRLAFLTPWTAPVN